GHDRLPAQFALGTHFAGHTRHFRGKGSQLVDHRVDGLLQLQNFTANVYRDLAGQVAVSDGNSYLRDVAHLASEVAGHGVHAVSQVLPGSGHAGDGSLTAQLALSTPLACDTSYCGCECAHLLDHRVDDRG